MHNNNSKTLDVYKSYLARPRTAVQKQMTGNIISIQSTRRPRCLTVTNVIILAACSHRQLSENMPTNVYEVFRKREVLKHSKANVRWAKQGQEARPKLQCVSKKTSPTFLAVTRESIIGFS